jgi:glucose/arabinose dehydrogenase
MSANVDVQTKEMLMRKLARFCLTAAPLAILAACDQPQSIITAPSLAAAAKKPSNTAPSRTVVASGLLNPRGIAFSKDGDLYVAEAGTTEGTTSTSAVCNQDPMPSLSGHTGRISRIVGGAPVPVVQGLPSSHHAIPPAAPTDITVFGIADIAFVGPKLYGLLNAGCGHGVPDVPASVIAVDDGGWSVVANLTAFRQANVPVHLGPDVEPDGDWYSMIAVGGVLYAIDANGGQLASVKPNSGKVDQVIDISATQGHIVPTTVAEYHGDFYVGNLQTFPAVTGASKIFQIKHNGKDIDVAATGFTTVLGIDFDTQGRMYVLESFGCLPQLPCVPAPFAQGTGKVTRVNADGSKETVVSGLTFPSSIRFGPDGALYISNKSYNLPAGAGEIIRVTF